VLYLEAAVTQLEMPCYWISMMGPEEVWLGSTVCEGVTGDFHLQIIAQLVSGDPTVLHDMWKKSEVSKTAPLLYVNNVRVASGGQGNMSTFMY
jgi:hypothetical protein